MNLKEIVKDAKENGFLSIKIDINKEKFFKNGNNIHEPQHIIRYLGLIDNKEILLARESQNGYAKERAKSAQKFFSTQNLYSRIYHEGKELR